MNKYRLSSQLKIRTMSSTSLDSSKNSSQLLRLTESLSSTCCKGFNLEHVSLRKNTKARLDFIFQMS